jgi:hypothetical protein
MNRPVCQACNQRLCAVNYIKDGTAHYRSRCEHCIKRSRGIKPPEPRWKQSGYKKKTTCDRCGFRSRYAAQLVVFHVDGNLNNSGVRNLKTVCQNCAVEIRKLDFTWQPGDLEPDR